MECVMEEDNYKYQLWSHYHCRNKDYNHYEYFLFYYECLYIKGGTKVGLQLCVWDTQFFKCYLLIMVLFSHKSNCKPHPFVFFHLLFLYHLTHNALTIVKFISQYLSCKILNEESEHHLRTLHSFLGKGFVFGCTQDSCIMSSID